MKGKFLYACLRPAIKHTHLPESFFFFFGKNKLFLEKQKTLFFFWDGEKYEKFSLNNFQSFKFVRRKLFLFYVVVWLAKKRGERGLTSRSFIEWQRGKKFYDTFSPKRKTQS